MKAMSQHAPVNFDVFIPPNGNRHILFFCLEINDVDDDGIACKPEFWLLSEEQ